MFCVCRALLYVLVGDGVLRLERTLLSQATYSMSLLCSDSIDLHVGSIIHQQIANACM